MSRHNMSALQQLNPNVQRGGKFKRKAKEGSTVTIKRINHGIGVSVDYRKHEMELSPVKEHLLEALERRQQEQKRRIIEAAAVQISLKEAARKKSKQNAAVIEEKLQQRKNGVSKKSPSKLKGAMKVKKLIHMAKEGFEYGGLETLRQDESLIDVCDCVVMVSLTLSQNILNKTQDCELLDLPRPDWSPVSSYCTTSSDEEIIKEQLPVTPQKDVQSNEPEIPSTPPQQTTPTELAKDTRTTRVTFSQNIIKGPKIGPFGSGPPLL